MLQGDFAPEGGACAGYPTDWWFPTQSKAAKREELVALRQTTERAKIICIGCPVRQECLEYSLIWEPFGIWGGHTEQERAEMRWDRNILLHREGRIMFSGIGVRDANGVGVFGQK
jgi:WhiB family redox-sensing transcriptional regulator